MQPGESATLPLDLGWVVHAGTVGREGVPGLRTVLLRVKAAALG